MRVNSGVKMTAFTAVNKLVVEKVDYGAIASAAVQSQSTEVEFKSVVASLKKIQQTMK